MSVAGFQVHPPRPPRAPRPPSTHSAHSSTHRHSQHGSSNGHPPELHVSPPLPAGSAIALVLTTSTSSATTTKLAVTPKRGNSQNSTPSRERTPDSNDLASSTRRSIVDPSPSETFFTASTFRYQPTTDSGVGGLSRKSSSIRDSSETHAVTIYDMYSEEGPTIDLPPRGRSDDTPTHRPISRPRPPSSFFNPAVPDVRTSTDSQHPASITLLPYAMPAQSPPSSRPHSTADGSVDTSRPIPLQPFPRQETPTNRSSHDLYRPPSRTRLSKSTSYSSLRPNFSHPIRPRTPSNSQPVPPNNDSVTGLDIPAPLRISTSSPSHHPRTSTTAPARSRPSTSHSHSQRGSTEEPDSYHVRSTYARLEALGVQGDGFDDGVEMTRTRTANASSTSGPAAAEPLPVPVDKGTDLTDRQYGLLRDLDRYGFFVASLSSRPESRLALLPSPPLQQKLAQRRRTSASSASTPPVPPDVFGSTAPPNLPIVKEASRLAKWNRMMRAERRDEGGNVEMWSFKGGLGRGGKAERRIWKGIPDMWRPGVWWTLIESKLREDMLREPRRRVEWNELARIYRDAMDKPSSFDIQIDLDVPRTISGHILFHTRYGQGQRSLFHVLHCFSLRCEDCGYVQGMGLIAATLLCYLEPERVYASLVRLHDEYEMHSIFQPGFPGMLESIYVQERLIQRFMPDVYQSFEKNMISTTSYATKWYITLFANTLPFQTQLRLWDAFFLEGRDVIIAVAVAIVWVLKDHLASPKANLETILSLLSSYYVAEDEDALLQWVHKLLSDRKVRDDMCQWRLDWKDLVSTGQSARALL